MVNFNYKPRENREENILTDHPIRRLNDKRFYEEFADFFQFGIDMFNLVNELRKDLSTTEIEGEIKFSLKFARQVYSQMSDMIEEYTQRGVSTEGLTKGVKPLETLYQEFGAAHKDLCEYFIERQKQEQKK